MSGSCDVSKLLQRCNEDLAPARNAIGRLQRGFGDGSLKASCSLLWCVHIACMHAHVGHG